MILSDIIGFLRTIINKLFTDKNIIIECQSKVEQLEKSGELYKIAGAYGLSIAEASSKDKWTSRGRPAVIYVTLLFLLFSVPFGVFYAIFPAIAVEIMHGMRLWFDTIPRILYECLSAIIITYGVCRTYEKKHKVAK